MEEVKKTDRYVWTDNEISVDSLGLLLKRARQQLKLTQREVAEEVGIPIQSYQAFESGKRDIRRASFAVAYRVLRTLELTTVPLLFDMLSR